MKLLAGTVQRIVGAAATAGPATLVPESRGSPAEGALPLHSVSARVLTECLPEGERAPWGRTTVPIRLTLHITLLLVFR